MATKNLASIPSELSATQSEGRNREPGEYFFKFQFFIHQVSLTKDFYNVTKPALAIRFLDFPTLIIHGELTSDGRLIFEKGKTTKFKMHSEDLRAGLLTKPFFVMFIDAESTNVQMLASSNVNVKILGQNYEFFSEETLNVNLRRNILYLFDQIQNEAVKCDVSLGVSLVDRETSQKLAGKVDRACPNIPGARMTGKEDRGPLHMQKPLPHESAQQNKMEKPYVAPMNNNFVGGGQQQASYDPSDPQAIIRQSKAQKDIKSPEFVEDSYDRSGKIADQIADKEDQEAQMAYAKERQEFVQRLEQEHYQHSQMKASESSMASLLNKPYCPPTMVFTQKVAAPPERAVLTKAAVADKSATTTKGQTLKIVREAMDVQEQKYRQMLEAKDNEIARNQELLISYKRELQAKENVKQDPNVIQITELQKLAQMETTDKYAVLEFLVKELMGMRKDEQLRQQQRPVFQNSNVQYEFEDRIMTPGSINHGRERAQTFDAGYSGKKKVTSGREEPGQSHLTNQVNQMFANSGPQSDRPNDTLKQSIIPGQTASIIEESMREFDETLGESQQIIGQSISNKKGKQTPVVKGTLGAGKMRQSADKDGKKHVTISEENQSQTHTEGYSYYGDEFESVSVTQSRVSGKRRPSNAKQHSKRKSNTSATMSYSQNFEESKSSESHTKKVSNFTAKRQSSDGMNKNKYSSTIKEQKEEATPATSEDYTSVEGSQSTYRNSKMKKTEAPSSEQKPKQSASIGHNESSSYMSSADKKANLATKLKQQQSEDAGAKALISVSGLSMSGTQKQASSLDDDTEEAESTPTDSISQSDVKTKLWAAIASKYLGGGAKKDGEESASSDDSDGVSASVSQSGAV